LAGAGPKAGPGSRPRLRSPDIRRVIRDGTSERSGRVVLYVAPGEGPARAAWVTGRTVGGAVARNRARRLFREAWRALAPGVEDGHDLVLVARGPFGRARVSELIEEIDGLLRRARLIER
jgi:ribonuclease P protein component